MKILALDIGGSKMLAAITETASDRLEIGPISYRKLQPDCTKERLLTLIDECIDALNLDGVERIGATIPGLADPASGIWIYSPFSGIRDVPVGPRLSAKYGLPVAIDNDVNACALAEKALGVCRDVNDYLWMTVSNGIGGGLVLNGRLFPGHAGGAAEIGHFAVVDRNPFPCGCGNVGCLEAEAAGPGIAKRYARLTGTILSAREIAELAKSGDEQALTVIETTGSLLGRAASYAVNLLNLEKVVFGGGVMESFELFYPSMERTFRAGLFRGANSLVRLEKTALGYNAALVGAVTLALSQNATSPR